ncbi:oxidoreductase [Kwoniella mangroviensis CBS 10435]|uniref:Oxidoreductase n=1 Tax=Kwoniella mangroviensis CBS 10435 TaxID=1331196 RepID=A0A1B9J108_9TREE|nr:oxidoreductase [Kwoniella mangroviensis CBS 8507]OCF61471.1 oxidoreductase [Kwoniella mangroviensis CBS 10435]OCF64709.1 oxidoreductase [Kwoniella mangroviensis CBS 8507]OCF77491.1 oxidoreductase [Kwoniella mangroviensis CBS 8886]
MSETYENAVITVELSDSKLEEVKKAYQNVYYHPDGQVPEHHLKVADIWYANWSGFPPCVAALGQIPRVKILQLSSAGANDALQSAIMSSDEARKQIKVCSSSGMHVLSIPQYIVGNVINLYMKLHIQLHIARSRSTWPARDQVVEQCGASGEAFPGNRSLSGKTVGLLGYGHIARETARLFKAFNCKIIAANSKGDRRAEEGYRMPGTGDADGSIPEQFYSTNDELSFQEFLGRCDILVASLPSTPQTTNMLKQKHLESLPHGSVFVNVGRGDLVKSEDILEALDTPRGLWGAVLDVTDPEPLTEGHPLYTHSNVIVTPHTSGSVEGYFDVGADILIAQSAMLRENKEALNVVDPAKGY